MYLLIQKNVEWIVIGLFIIMISACDISDSSSEVENEVLDDSYLSYSDWKPSSIPQQLIEYSNISETNLVSFKANIFWLNIDPPTVFANEIVDNVSNSLTVQALDIVYSPRTRGSYNTNNSYVNSDSSWAGVMTAIKYDDTIELADKFSSSYLTMWVKYNENNPVNSFLVEIGKISEDVINNYRFDHEDRNYNGKLDENEDTGIDGFFDNDEPLFSGTTNLDPNNDNYNYWFPNFQRYNFQENNGMLDSEDLNGNYKLDKPNDYFAYEIPIDSLQNSFISEYRENGWFKLRIPLNEYSYTIGTPIISELTTLRLWFNGKTDDFNLKIVEIKFVVE